MIHLVEISIANGEINQGGWSSDSCPVFLAIEKVIKPEYVVRVGYKTVKVFNSTMEQLGELVLPSDAQKFIKQFQTHGSKYVKEFAFDMFIPKSYLRN